MRVLLCDDRVDEEPPSDWTASMTQVVGGRRLRFGLANVADTAFKDADYNRQHVLVRVLAFSLNHRDTALLVGDHPDHVFQRSRGIGSDFVARVVAVGSEVEHLAVGDRVMPAMDWPPRAADDVAAGVPTNHASRELQRLHSSRLVRVPAGMRDEVAAACSVGAQTAYGMLRRARVGPGTSLLVTAATSVTSLFVISGARARGARVQALSRSGRGQALLRRLGVEAVYRPDSAADMKELSAVARRTRGFEAVIDPFCDTYLLSATKLLGFGGRYVTCRLVGGPDDEPSGSVSAGHILQMMTSVVAKNASINGQCLGERQDLEAALADVAAGATEVVLDSVHAASDVEAFLRRAFDPDRLGKVVYRFGPTEEA